MSANEDDWRLMGQEEYLGGVALRWKKYARWNEAWDHDHCQFCWAKFAEPDHIPDALHAGYATLDNYRWICEGCFRDFRERFGWTVGDHGP